jgi:hypothetical protein
MVLVYLREHHPSITKISGLATEENKITYIFVLDQQRMLQNYVAVQTATYGLICKYKIRVYSYVWLTIKHSSIHYGIMYEYVYSS